MYVRDVMTSDPRTCGPETSVAMAAALMLEGDCGILPIVSDGRLVGVVTDRDLFIALATRDRRASELTVGEVARTPVRTCGPDDDVRAALAAITQHRVRRLPVVDTAGAVVGIVSMNDLVLVAGAEKPVRDAEVLGALQAICAHHRLPHVVAA